MEPNDPCLSKLGRRNVQRFQLQHFPPLAGRQHNGTVKHHYSLLFWCRIRRTLKCVVISVCLQFCVFLWIFSCNIIVVQHIYLFTNCINYRFTYISALFSLQTFPSVLKCEYCKNFAPASQFRGTKRFCSMTCAKRYFNMHEI